MFDLINNLLFFLLLTPFIGSLVVFCLPINNLLCKQVGFAFSLISFFLSCILWVFFDANSSTFQFIFFFKIPFFQSIEIAFGVDGISLFFIILTSFLIPLCLVSAWDLLEFKIITSKIYFSLFLLIEFFIFLVFISLDVFVFYIFFEAVLIPIFIIIGFYGSRSRKVRAGILFFFYTLFGSLFILIAIIFILFELGSTNYFILLENSFSCERQKLLWLAFFISFAVKVPIVPFHIWLPEAHVEAPTGGSVLLAGILLKLGTYGIIRFLLPLFPIGNYFFKPFVYLLCVIAVVYTSITALRQTDIKRVIAYASVAHINLTLVGLFSFNIIGIEGSILQILSHGLVSGALFFCVGVLYDRHHSRLIQYYSGIVQSIPVFIFFFLFFTIANIALPGTSSFVGEFLILLGTFQDNTVVAFFGGTGMILSGAYSLWLFNRIAYGAFKVQFLSFSKDLSKKEIALFYPLSFFTLFIGIYPNFFLIYIHPSVINIIRVLQI